MKTFMFVAGSAILAMGCRSTGSSNLRDEDAAVSTSALVPAEVILKDAKLSDDGKALELEVAYAIGCGDHKFKLKVGTCQETSPVSCEAEIVHLSNDICEAAVVRRIKIGLGEAGLDQDYYSKGSLAIRGSAPTNVKVLKLPQLPLANGSAAAGAQDGGIKFADWTCRASDANNANPLTIKVQKFWEAQIVPTYATEYLGTSIHVGFHQGQFEAGEELVLRIDDELAVVHQPAKGLYQLRAKGVFLQCYFEAGKNVDRVKKDEIACIADYKVNTEKRALQVTHAAGAMIVPESVSQWKGYSVSARLDLGDAFETQQNLTIGIDASRFTTYVPGKALVTLSSGKAPMRVQCAGAGID